MASRLSCLWPLRREPVRGTLARPHCSSASGKLGWRVGGEGVKGKSTSNTEVPITVSFWMMAMYLFPRGLVVKFTSTVFSSFLQAVMSGSHRLPIKSITWVMLPTLPSLQPPKGLYRNKSEFSGTHASNMDSTHSARSICQLLEW